jgi:cytidine deaminase
MSHSKLPPNNVSCQEPLMSHSPEDLLNEAKKVLPHAYAPYSNFPVAACVRAASGKVFSGINVENASYSLTSCAEKNAISAMAMIGDRKITEALILVPGPMLCPPCGACRQILLEFAIKGCRIHLCTETGKHASYTLEELLPITFNSDHFEEGK